MRAQSEERRDDDGSDRAKPEARAPRKASRESRREQLIEATIETIAACGLSRTTLTEVADAAGLSATGWSTSTSRARTGC